MVVEATPSVPVVAEKALDPSAPRSSRSISAPGIGAPFASESRSSIDALSVYCPAVSESEVNVTEVEVTAGDGLFDDCGVADGVVLTLGPGVVG